MNAKQKMARFAGLVGGMVLSGVAAAQTAGDDLVTTVTTELSGGKTQLYTIGGAVLALVAVVALIRHLRSAVR
ncbi:major capsid protein [Dyella sp. KRB-257]|uniref:major capsid protein n=1 Tax=Dyella sp. KRB-257 TaxID=3400915 RepID=UPI003C0EE6C4